MPPNRDVLISNEEDSKGSDSLTGSVLNGTTNNDTYNGQGLPMTLVNRRVLSSTGTPGNQTPSFYLEAETNVATSKGLGVTACGVASTFVASALVRPPQNMPSTSMAREVRFELYMTYVF